VGEQAIADRYSYVSLLGIFAAVSFGLREGLERLGVRARIIVAGFAAIAFVLLAVRCADQVGVWRNSLILYESSVASTPNGAALQFNFGNRLLDVGREEEAIRHLESARSLRPDWHSPTANLAWLLATTDDAALVDPDRSLQLALEVTDERGNDANLLDTLAAAYAATGEFDRTESVARRAVSLARAARRSGSARTFEAR